ncbi:putative protein tyrosine phosphatase type IVA A [Cardiosporidium cionae]|uniref:Uncharacterized protein n=1 Tax=Cardiosporidium cionae TaxID=476202 RepID=A0ABQ7JC73_9APIC|nr:putative protein tyrosine phosphatase type IVA A [Cardiosporidium cionae]|eukprot:KAF8821489.1 putative protein tyrosine phosphatase type IVA A [Cardiosporidium cionae]
MLTGDSTTPISSHWSTSGTVNHKSLVGNTVTIGASESSALASYYINEHKINCSLTEHVQSTADTSPKIVLTSDDCSTLPSEGPDVEALHCPEGEKGPRIDPLKEILPATSMVQSIMNAPTRVEHGKLKFLILDAPSNENLLAYVKEMRSYGVIDLVRTCESAYDDRVVEAAGIRVHAMVFPDGEAPLPEIIDDWMDVVKSCINSGGAIAVHCVAGLGRAPVLVAIALIENGMDPINAVMFIRDRRRGAINRRQLQFLKNYKSRNARGGCCMTRCTIA